MIRILFVCHGNICRSPMAEFVMRDLADKAGLAGEIEIASAATSTEEIGNDLHHGTRRVLDKHGVPYGHRKARQIRAVDYESFDYLVGMDARNLANMRRAFGGDPNAKVSLLLDWEGEHRDVADPWYTGDFETTFADVLSGCTALLEACKRELRE